MRIHCPQLLLIEDDPDFRDLVIHWLHGRFSVSSAGEGAEGYSLALSNPPDVIILDLNMRGWDGIQTLTAIRNNPVLRDIPVLILSGDNRIERAAAALEAGANQVLLKDQFSPEEMIALLIELAGSEADV